MAAVNLRLLICMWCLYTDGFRVGLDISLSGQPLGSLKPSSSSSALLTGVDDDVSANLAISNSMCKFVCWLLSTPWLSSNLLSFSISWGNQVIFSLSLSRRRYIVCCLLSAPWQSISFSLSLSRRRYIFPWTFKFVSSHTVAKNDDFLFLMFVTSYICLSLLHII